MSELLLRFREPLSAAGSAMLILLLLLFHFWAPALRHPETSFAPIELTLSESEVQQPTDQLVAQPPQTIPAIQHNVSNLVAPPKQSIIPTHTATAPAAPPTQAGEAPAIHDSAPPSPVLPGTANPLAAPSATPVDSWRNVEAIYAGRVRAYLQSTKRYPTGREASLQRPAGTSVVWFMVRRSGELVEAGIEASSGSMLLDSAALATVRRSTYPVFPDEAWPGKIQQRFSVELNFVPAH